MVLEFKIVEDKCSQGVNFSCFTRTGIKKAFWGDIVYSEWEKLSFTLDSLGCLSLVDTISPLPENWCDEVPCYEQAVEVCRSYKKDLQRREDSVKADKLVEASRVVKNHYIRGEDL